MSVNTRKMIETVIAERGPHVSGTTRRIALFLWRHGAPTDHFDSDAIPQVYRKCAIAIMTYRGEIMEMLGEEKQDDQMA